jgi:uncharacterized membrane protein
VRSLQVQVHADRVDTVLSCASQQRARSATALRAERVRRDGRETEGAWSLVFVTLPNERVGTFIDAVRREVDDAEFVLLPVGVLPLDTPVERLDEPVRDVSRLSTLELVVASLQSVGAWRGMLLFSLLAGTIAAYGLIFDVVYLLVAAMLINPMGAPALVAVIGVSIGDVRMFGRGGLRFAVSLIVQAATAMALGFAYRLSLSTTMMEQVAALSTWAVLVALAAGAAGAQTQVKSDRDSLVSGTAAGFMVAAALAPPAAVLGLAIPLGRWDYLGLMSFLLALQFLAIAAGGAAVLRLFGVRPEQPSIGRGSAAARGALLVAVVAGTFALVLWQTGQSPRFRKADLSRVALEIVRDAVDEVPGAYLIASSARFTRRDLERYDREGLLFEITVERTEPALSDAELESGIRRGVWRLVHERMEDVMPFVQLSVVAGAEPSRPPREDP